MKTIENIAEIKNKCKLCNGTGYTIKNTELSEVFEECCCVKQINELIKYFSSGIPERYWNWSLDSLTEEFKNSNLESYNYIISYIASLEENILQGNGIILVSDPGLAKTSIMTYIVKSTIDLGYRGFYTSASCIQTKKFESIDNYDSKEFLDDIINNVDVLALDEVDRVYLSNERAMPNKLYFEFLSDVYDSKKVLLVSTNSVESLKVFPLHIKDRLRTLMQVNFNGKSGRKRKKNAS